MKMISKKIFGKTKRGETVTEYTITNKENESIKILDYGCIIRCLNVKNNTDSFTDVVLGYDTIQEYEEKYDTYFGAVIGRYANRLGGAEFTLNNKTYTLAKNNGNNHLHGGWVGFDKVVWKEKSTDDNTIIFEHLSPDGDEGYPANLNVTVTYTFTDNGELYIKYDATADNDTIINMTNHSYFNLDGQGDILSQYLMLNADKFTENSAECLPTGVITDVANTPMDFRKSKKIGEDINKDYEQLKNVGGYDHNFILSEGTGLKHFATAYSEKTGIELNAYTTQIGVQLYTGNFISKRTGKNGTEYKENYGFCLETQGFPNSMEIPHFPKPILLKADKYHHETLYKFNVK